MKTIILIPVYLYCLAASDYPTVEEIIAAAAVPLSAIAGGHAHAH